MVCISSLGELLLLRSVACRCVCVCAQYMACSSAFVSVLGKNSGRERVTHVQAVLVRGSAEKSLLNGSSE